MPPPGRGSRGVHAGGTHGGLHAAADGPRVRLRRHGPRRAGAPPGSRRLRRVPLQGRPLGGARGDGLPYVVDLLLLVFLIALRCRRRPCPPAAAAKAALDAGYRPRPAADRVDWDAIRAPTYEYLAEVVRILSREDHVAEASPIV
ncbi:unnamed protein product [Spirodela intermedia]|uniref:Uncharacterized protein n=1 Tax=Spirodela intermedia TaxID=51605 RepID=A0A7I8IIV3_SPIIN|nr:unnamed protein product [Spirodela intermedia]CAA6656884.1 unnamed protein product [Spirodela intermedia]